MNSIMTGMVMLTPDRRIWVLAALCSIFLSAGLPPGAAAGDAHRDLIFVRHVLTTKENAEGIFPVQRWTRPVTVVVAFDGRQRRRIFHSVMSELNTVLAGTGMQLRGEFRKTGKGGKDGDHDIVIGTIAEERIHKALRHFGCEGRAVPAYGALCVNLLKGSNVIGHAAIAIDEQLTGAKFRGTLLEELYQSLGITNDHAVYEDSVNFEDGRGSTGLSVLGPRDKKVLYFLYKYLEPGDDEAVVKEKFDKYWQTIEVE